MAEVIFEVIAEIFFETIPRYFGAFLKWMYLKFEIPYSKVLAQKGNSRIGFVSLGIITLVILLFFKFK